ARRDDRGTYSAALFSLGGGDVRAVELPERGHDIRASSGLWRMGGVCPQAWPLRRRRPDRWTAADLIPFEPGPAFLQPWRLLGRRQAALHHRERLSERARHHRRARLDRWLSPDRRVPGARHGTS